MIAAEIEESDFPQALATRSPNPLPPMRLSPGEVWYRITWSPAWGDNPFPHGADVRTGDALPGATLDRVLPLWAKRAQSGDGPALLACVQLMPGALIHAKPNRPRRYVAKGTDWDFGALAECDRPGLRYPHAWFVIWRLRQERRQAETRIWAPHIELA